MAFVTEADPGRTRSWSERIAWLGYWLAFAAVAVRGGFQPGLTPRPDLLPYPWLEVIWTVTLLGIATLALRRILRLHVAGWSWSRWVVATVLAGVYAMWEVAMIATDLPGYVYVMPFYAVVTVSALVAAGMAVLGRTCVLLLSGHSRRAA
jgi:hypothetical protein